MSGLASPARLRPQVFSTSRRFISSTANLPALFRAGSVHGVAPFKALFLPRGRTPFPVPIPSWCCPFSFPSRRLAARAPAEAFVEPPCDLVRRSRAEAPSRRALPSIPAGLGHKPVRWVRRAVMLLRSPKTSPNHSGCRLSVRPKTPSNRHLPAPS
jgi:hypothetical protein